MVVIKVI